MKTEIGKIKRYCDRCKKEKTFICSTTNNYPTRQCKDCGMLDVVVR